VRHAVPRDDLGKVLGQIVSVSLARDEYLPLMASAEAQVWMARPEGFERAVQTLRIDGVEELVRAIRAV
jgi:hypothetical protein